ncbi:P44/Msp2 family outer membrane protein [Anaplasma marginale]|uniref:P44/Msp2 family outer membrane protein n=1 Tax=Anaplasma marginale TaxID=770 RepID=UPI0012396A56|nr:P44/Msp2 family outer membrane protein [Anaplasma marginale]KAA8472571.1 P44/Msp2 family outer membrane protein [Anaplasma marginale]KAB0450992.1 P44/Msp2 family outer membrane protein [Anaplasma marginale]
MSRKSLFVLPCLLFVAVSTAGNGAAPNVGSAAPGVGAEGELYVAAQYKPALPVVREFAVRENRLTAPSKLFRLAPSTSVLTAEQATGATLLDSPLLRALRDRNNFEPSYTPSYEVSMCGVSGVLGYSRAGTRVELEVSFEDFRVKKSGKPVLKGGHEYFAAGRTSDTQRVVFANRAISAGSAVVSICRDFPAAGPSGGSVTPYTCLGGGVEFLDILGMANTRFAYQAKMGAALNLHPRASIFAAGYYRGTLERAIRPLPAVVVIPATAGERENLGLPPFEGNAGVRYLGVEAGIRVLL